MASPEHGQPFLHILSKQKEAIDADLGEFPIDRQSRNLTPKTILWYRQSLDIFRAFLPSLGVIDTAQITPSVLRRFLLSLQESGHNPGGIKNIYGAVKAFLTWYADEAAPTGWGPTPCERSRRRRFLRSRSTRSTWSTWRRCWPPARSEP